MTVTISSTTDTQAEVESASNHANPPDEIPATNDVVEVAARYQQPEVSADEAATAETLDAAGEGEEPAPDVVAEEPDEAPEEAVADVTAAEAQEDDMPEAPKKRRRRGRSYKDRASQLAREKASEKGRADSLQAELDGIKAARDRVLTPPEPPVKPETPIVPGEDTVEVAPRYRQPDVSPDVAAAPSAGRPNQDDFETYDQFQEALVDWKVNLRLTERDAVERERIERVSAKRAHDAVVDAHAVRIDTFRAAHSDFDAVIEQGKSLPMTKPMQDSVLNSDMGPAVMYHLCQFPEECDRMAAMPPMVAIREMGKLEARIEAAQTGPASSAASMTSAPRPIKPVGGGATASTVPLDQMDYQSYRRARMKQFGR
jgi:hypothetical protein